MRPDKTSVYDFFDKERQYAVPLYQRQYVWTEDEQWAHLWEDISGTADRVRLGEALAPHFLGAIVTSQRPVFGQEMSSWEIVDGQQRLTTLQLVLAAFRDVAHSLGESQYDRDLQRITRNEGVMREPSEKFKVWPTNSDRSVFEKVMETGGLEPLIHFYPGLRGRGKRQTPRLAEAYAFFFKQLGNYVSSNALDGDVTPTHRLESLFETFRRHLQIVNIELEAGDDPQVIFESLNGHGVPLLPSDLVRNFIFMKAKRQNVDVDSLHARFWRPYDEERRPGQAGDDPWWKQAEKQGRIKRPRLDLFLFHYLQYRTEQEINIGHLFLEFRNWWEQATAAAGSPAEALKEMQRYSGEFASWLEPRGTDRLAQFSRVLRSLDTSTLYPALFLLLVEAQPEVPSGDLLGIVDDLESYLVRRAVCRLTNKQYNRFFLGLLRHLRRMENITRAGVRSHLAAGTGDSVRWPGDEEFGQAFLHRPLYRELRRDVTLLLLDALEQALLTAKHERFEIIGKLSIEHIMPQSWEKEWELRNDTDEGRERRERVLHSIGNLTLVTPAFNTSLSNRGFDRKLKEFKRIGRLLLNRTFEDLPSWNEDAMLSRGKELFELARRRWPHPASPDSLKDMSLDYVPSASWKRSGDSEEPYEPPIDVAAARGFLDQFTGVLRRQAAAE